MVSAIIGAISVAILLIVLLGGLYWKIAENKADLNAEIGGKLEKQTDAIHENTKGLAVLEEPRAFRRRLVG